MIEMSIVTGTRHRKVSLARFMSSVFATAGVPTEIIIADASDDPPSIDWTHSWNEYVKSVIHYHESPRLGTVRGYNAAFKKATGRYVAWFNDDCTLLPGWDKIAITWMDKYPELGLGAIYWRDPGASYYYLQSLHNIVYPNFGVFRSDVLKQTGGFDEREVFVPETQKMERLEFYGCDTSAAYLVVDAGYAVAGIPGCKVEHHREPDAERQANYQKHVFGDHGNIAGKILFELWGGLRGFERLREKYNRFSYLHQPLTCQ